MSLRIEPKIITKRQIYQRGRTKANRYISLNNTIDNDYAPLFRLSPACPATVFLLQIKKQWGLPQETCFLSKVSGLYYLLYPISSNADNANKSIISVIDPLPINKIPLDKLSGFKKLIQRLFLYRYILGLNMTISNLYCTFNHDNEINCIYSYRESKPYGLSSKTQGVLPGAVPVCKSRWPGNVLKKFFADESPYEVLAEWWELSVDNKTMKVEQLYNWLKTLVEYQSHYSTLPDLVFLRLNQLIG